MSVQYKHEAQASEFLDVILQYKHEAQASEFLDVILQYKHEAQASEFLDVIPSLETHSPARFQSWAGITFWQYEFHCQQRHSATAKRASEFALVSARWAWRF